MLYYCTWTITVSCFNESTTMTQGILNMKITLQKVHFLKSFVDVMFRIFTMLKVLLCANVRNTSATNTPLSRNLQVFCATVLFVDGQRHKSPFQQTCGRYLYLQSEILLHWLLILHCCLKWSCLLKAMLHCNQPFMDCCSYPLCG